jgi:hypothetical protein
VSRNVDPPLAARAGGFAVVLLITAFFGAWWGLVGASALPDGLSLPATLVVVAVTAILLLAAARLFRLSRRSPNSPPGAGSNPFKARAYRLAVLFEVVTIPLAALVLNKAGHPDAVVSVVAAIVGLPFFGLVPAFRSWGFAAVGGAMVVVGVLSLLLPAAAAAGGGASPRSALVGIGCAFALWGGVLPPLVSTWRRAGTRSD